MCFRPVFVHTLCRTPSLTRDLRLPSRERPKVTPCNEGVTQVTEHVERLVTMVTLLTIHLVRHVLVNMKDVRVRDRLPSRQGARQGHDVCTLSFRSSRVRRLPCVNDQRDRGLVHRLVVVNIGDNLRASSADQVPRQFPSGLVHPDCARIPFHDVLEFRVHVTSIRMVRVHRDQRTVNTLRRHPRVRHFVNGRAVIRNST